MLDYISTSIRRKLTFVMLTTAVVALLVTSTAMIIYEAQTYHQMWVDDLVTQAEIIGKTSAPALSFNDPKAAQENLGVLRLSLWLRRRQSIPPMADSLPATRRPATCPSRCLAPLSATGTDRRRSALGVSGGS